MEGFIIYFLKVITLQGLLYGFYWLINRKSNSFHFNRYFLLAALILPIFIPLLNIPFNLFQSDIAAEGVFDPWLFIEQSLPLVTINGSSSTAMSISWWLILIFSIYIIVALPSLLKLLYDYYRIHKLAKSSTKKEYTPKGYRLLYVPSKILSFSFLDKIFLSDLFPLKKHEKKTIVTHEEYHLTQKHSLDIILAELVRIFCWFNPIILLIQKNLKETHEYLADRHTLKQNGLHDYASLLKSFKWQEINMMLGSAYSSASIKKRLERMEQSNKKSPYLNVFLLTVVALSTAFLFACEDNLNSFENKDQAFQYEISEAELEEYISIRMTNLENAPQDIIERFVTEQRDHPEYIYSPTIMWITDKQATKFRLGDFNSAISMGGLTYELEFSRMLTQLETQDYYGVEKIKKFGIAKSYAMIRRVDRLTHMDHVLKMNPEDNHIHDDFDRMAEFKGGMQALVEHLNENLIYPASAKELGIEDKLVMRFVVNKGGGLVYLNIDKEPTTTNEEVNIELQKAAFQAIRSTEGLWEPAEKDGKYVMSKMTLPIEFKLDKKQN